MLNNKDLYNVGLGLILLILLGICGCKLWNSMYSNMEYLEGSTSIEADPVNDDLVLDDDVVNAKGTNTGEPDSTLTNGSTSMNTSTSIVDTEPLIDELKRLRDIQDKYRTVGSSPFSLSLQREKIMQEITKGLKNELVSLRSKQTAVHNIVQNRSISRVSEQAIKDATQRLEDREMQIRNVMNSVEISDENREIFSGILKQISDNHQLLDELLDMKTKAQDDTQDMQGLMSSSYVQDQTLTRSTLDAISARDDARREQHLFRQLLRRAELQQIKAKNKQLLAREKNRKVYEDADKILTDDKNKLRLYSYYNQTDAMYNNIIQGQDRILLELSIVQSLENKVETALNRVHQAKYKKEIFNPTNYMIPDTGSNTSSSINLA